MNDDELELVTAYVDGEATPGERARVEAEPDLLAEVERQRVVRAQLHDVGAAASTAREHAIAAALAVFDGDVAGGTGSAGASRAPDRTVPTNIVPLAQRRRLRWMQGLSAAAAVAAVAVAGAVIATRGGDDGGSADELRTGTSTVNAQAAPADVTSAAAAPVTSDVTLMMAAEATAVEQESGDAAADAAASDVAGDSATAAAPAAPPPDAAAMAVVATDRDLIELAGEIKPGPPDVEDVDKLCREGLIKPDAMFEDAAGVQHPMIVVTVDEDTIGALTLDTCDVVLEAVADGAR